MHVNEDGLVKGVRETTKKKLRRQKRENPKEL